MLNILFFLSAQMRTFSIFGLFSVQFSLCCCLLLFLRGGFQPCQSDFLAIVVTVLESGAKYQRMSCLGWVQSIKVLCWHWKSTPHGLMRVIRNNFLLEPIALDFITSITLYATPQKHILSLNSGPSLQVDCICRLLIALGSGACDIIRGVISDGDSLTTRVSKLQIIFFTVMIKSTWTVVLFVLLGTTRVRDPSYSSYTYDQLTFDSERSLLPTCLSLSRHWFREHLPLTLCPPTLSLHVRVVLSLPHSLTDSDFSDLMLSLLR